MIEPLSPIEREILLEILAANPSISAEEALRQLRAGGM
jgi:hypothetical protein